MNNYRVRLLASKTGSIGTKYGELRVYEIAAIDKKEAEDKARERAYAEGLEHTLITNTTLID